VRERCRAFFVPWTGPETARARPTSSLLRFFAEQMLGLPLETIVERRVERPSAAYGGHPIR
jgi:hypothetical protein